MTNQKRLTEKCVGCDCSGSYDICGLSKSRIPNFMWEIQAS